MLRNIVGFLCAVTGAYLFAVLTYSQLNLNRLIELGAPIGSSQRLFALTHDVLSMASAYLPILAVALLVAFVLAAPVARRLPRFRSVGFAFAGAVSVYAVILLLLLLFGTHGITVTRTLPGLISQCMAGALGGYIFAALTRAPGAKGAAA